MLSESLRRDPKNLEHLRICDKPGSEIIIVCTDCDFAVPCYCRFADGCKKPGFDVPASSVVNAHSLKNILFPDQSRE